MGLCPQTERCLVYMTYMFVAGIALGCSYRVRAIDKNWNWIYIAYFLITLNSISKLFQHENRLSLEHHSRSRSRQRWKSHSRIRNPSPSPSSNLHTSRRASGRNVNSRRCTFPIIPLCAYLKDLSCYLTSLWSLPCLLTQILLDNGIVNKYATVPLALTAFPLLVYLIDNVRENSMVDILIIGNVIFLSAFSTKFGCDYGLITAIEFSVTHFILKVHKSEDFSKDISYNIGIAVFCILSFSTINGSNVFDVFKVFDTNPSFDIDDTSSICANFTKRTCSEPSPFNIFLDAQL